MTTDNPFFETWTTPFGLPPFARIVPEHFPPAFERFMAEELEEVEAIADQAEPPSFANTIEALERVGKGMDRLSRVFYNLTSSATTDELDAIELELSPKLAQHGMRIALNPKLFARIARLYADRDALGLTEDQYRLLEDRYNGLVRAGAALSEDAKARMTAISERLAVLHTTFAQNVMHDEKQWAMALDAADLDGLPESLRDAAAQAAKERGLEAKFAVTLARSSVEPFLTFAARRDLREKAYLAWNQRGGHKGEHDNEPLIREILKLRAEQARLMGFENFAAYKLDDQMAKDVASVRRLLDQAWEPAKKKAAEERDALAALAREEGMNEAIQPWDWRYYAEKVRKARFDLDEGEVKPYFVLDNMVQAAFFVAGKLFGLSFAERPDIPVYHPDVKAYEVKDGSGKTVGVFLHDNFARPGKQSGAWMGSFRDQQSLDGEVLPVIVNNNNFAKAQPTLLSLTDALTLFHEFGHGLHGLLSNVRYPSQSGTSVKRDFVEFPSQVLENWLLTPEVLGQFARHAKTGQPMPDALLRRLIAARTFNQGFMTVEYTAASLLDLEFHTLSHPDIEDVDAFEAEICDRIGMPPEIKVRHRPKHFGHLFSGGGYAAGYYAYMWAEVLDADGFAAFEEAGDVFSPALAARLKAVFSAGGTRDPMALYAGFRGREPKVEALLAKRGLQ